MNATIPEVTSIAAWKQIAEDRLSAVETWKEKSAAHEAENVRLRAALEKVSDVALAQRQPPTSAPGDDLKWLVARKLYEMWNFDSDRIEFEDANTQIISSFGDDAEELIGLVHAYQQSGNKNG